MDSKKIKYWTLELLTDSLIQLRITLPVCFNHSFTWRRGRIVHETLRCLFYFTQCLMDKIQIVNYSKRDTSSSEAHTSVAHHSHRPENPKSRIISWTHTAEDGLPTRWATVAVLWSTLCWHGGPLSPCHGLHFADTVGHCHRATVYTLLTRWATVTLLWYTLCWHGEPLSPYYGILFADTVGHCHRAMVYAFGQLSICLKQDRTHRKEKGNWRVCSVHKVETVSSFSSPVETSNKGGAVNLNGRVAM